MKCLKVGEPMAKKASKIDIPVSAPLIVLRGPELQLSPVQHLPEVPNDHPPCDEGQEG